MAHHQHKRIYLDKQHPEVFKSLTGFAAEVRTAIEAAGLSRRLAELVNLRVSQIHGCAFCLNSHLRAGLRAGVTEQEVAVLPAWRDTTLFTEEERAALELAEFVAGSPTVPRDERYENARVTLGDEATSAVVWGAIAISSFNAVSILSGHPVG